MNHKLFSTKINFRVDTIAGNVVETWVEANTGRYFDVFIKFQNRDDMCIFRADDINVLGQKFGWDTAWAYRCPSLSCMGSFETDMLAAIGVQEDAIETLRKLADGDMLSKNKNLGSGHTTSAL